MLKRRFACVCCALVWLISIVCGSMLVVNLLVAQCAMVVMFEISLIATIGSYIRIYFTVRKLNQDGFHTAAHYNTNDAKLKIEVQENEPALHHRVCVRQESRVTNLVFLLLVVLFVTVLPYMGLLQVAVVDILDCPTCKRSPRMLIALDVLYPIEMLNFLINPVIYAWRLPKFRQVSKRTFSKFICCMKWKANSQTTVARRDASCSGSSESIPHSPATIFTGGNNTESAALNNNTHFEYDAQSQ